MPSPTAGRRKICRGGRQIPRPGVVARILSAERRSERFPVLQCLMRLRSAVGVRESGAKSGEKRIAHRSRSATAAVEPQTEARRSCALAAHARMPLVTSARFAQRNERGREGDGDDQQPVERSKLRVGHGAGSPNCGLVTAQGAGYCMPMSAIEVSSHIQLDERGVAWIDQTRLKVIEVAMDWLANRSSAEEMHL